MVLTACHCNFGIKGVQTLPAHNHLYTGEYETVPNTNERTKHFFPTV